MKKIVSLLIVIALLVSIIFVKPLQFSANAACVQHTYTNACDADCDKCGAKRTPILHDYQECFVGYENNIDYLGEWKIKPNKTGIYEIQPIDNNAAFTSHYLFITDKNGCEVKFYDRAKGWPLVAGKDYTIRLKCQYDASALNAEFNKRMKTQTVFSDTNKNDWYNDAVTYTVGAGIISGYQNGKFGAGDSIQRQDFLVMLARFDGANLEDYSGKSKFPDVERDSYYEAAINWGVEHKVVYGYENGYFGVGDSITREQMVTFLYRYADYKKCDINYTTQQKNEAKNKYTDFKNVSEFSQKATIWALSKGVISGKEISGEKRKLIAPQDKAQRCEAAQIMYNIFLSEIISGVKPCIHNCVDATCTTPKKCKKCNLTFGDALGHNYVLGECTNINNGQLCGDYDAAYCPKLYFTGNMDNMTSKKDVRNITFEYRSKDQVITGAAKIKPQGTSSMKYDKKNFTIDFYNDSSYSQKLGVNVGWGEQSKYCLKANWIDKTHSRNVVTAKLVGQMQRKYNLFMNAPNNGAIDGFPVEVYINNTFHGLYTMNIPKDAWQFGMDESNPNHIVICGDTWNDPVKFLSVPTDLKDWAVEVGPEDDATLKKVQRLCSFIVNSSDEEFEANFEQYLNLDATLNYYVMMTYGWMPDNYGKNMLLATYDGQVWYPSLYDLDTTWGTHWEGNKLYNYSSGVTNGSGSELWKKFERVYKEEIAARYFELREDVLDPEHIMDEFRSFYQSIPTEVLARETAKWNTTETPIPGYDISQISDYLNTVVPRLDARYNSWR